MAQPPSEHDEHRDSVDDFAPERPVVQPKHTDLESVVLWLADRWRDSRRIRSSFAGILVLLLVVGGAGIAWWAIGSGAPNETPAEPIASSRVKEQSIELPAIMPAVPSSSASAQAVSVDRNPLPLEKPRPVPAADSSAKVVERQSPSSPADPSQVSPPMPRPAPVPSPTPPVHAGEEEPPPARVAAPEPAAPASATTAPRSPGGMTTWGSSRPGVEDPESGAIQDLLGRYRTAYAALDAAGVRQLWPSVNQRSLERAFRQLEGQDISFFSCTIDVDGARAEVGCVGTTNFIPKVGNRSPQSGPSQWNFKLSKRSAGSWLIDDAQAR